MRGLAAYTAEHPVGGPLYLAPIQSRVARGRVTGLDVERALNEPGVVVVLNHHNALRVASGEDAELAVLQSPEVHFRGQLIGGVVASTRKRRSTRRTWWTSSTRSRTRRGSALGAQRPGPPDRLNGGHATDTAEGDVEAALSPRPPRSSTPTPRLKSTTTRLEPHATIACGRAMSSPSTTPPKGCTGSGTASPGLAWTPSRST